MEIALIHNNSLELGPMGFNVKYINADLEDLEVEERISPQSYTDLPQEVSPYRREKENTTITLDINGTSVQVSTSREERVLLASKLSAAPASCNYKFLSGWLEVTAENLQYIVSEIDKVVQAAFDWELAKLQEIDACTTIDEVYDVIVRELPEAIQPPVA